MGIWPNALLQLSDPFVRSLNCFAIWRNIIIILPRFIILIIIYLIYIIIYVSHMRGMFYQKQFNKKGKKIKRDFQQKNNKNKEILSHKLFEKINPFFIKLKLIFKS